jgi:hypothetical protein
VLGHLTPRGSDDSLDAEVATAFMLAILMHPRVRAMGTLSAAFLAIVLGGAALSLQGVFYLRYDEVLAKVNADPRTQPLVPALESAFGPPSESEQWAVAEKHSTSAYACYSFDRAIYAAEVPPLVPRTSARRRVCRPVRMTAAFLAHSTSFRALQTVMRTDHDYTTVLRGRTTV